MTKEGLESARKSGKLVIGTREVLRGLKSSKISSIFYSSNCPKDFLDDLNNYGSLAEVKIEKFEGNSANLGEACGKPFNVSVVGIKK